MTKASRGWATTATILATVVGGSVLNARRLSMPDSWCQDAPAQNRFYFDRHNAVSEDRVFRVSGAGWPEAEKRLQSRPLVPLSPTQANHLLGRPVIPPARTTPYLVRAVHYLEETGRFLVGQRDLALHVHHSCLGHPPKPPMRRAALVVYLKQKPENVYVTCSMAE